MNNFEEALNKLDLIEQNLNNQAAEINNAAEQITLKDNRLTQLEKLFKGTAKIFSKQHNYVDKLQKDLEKNIKELDISQEEIRHFEEDIDRLNEQKTELKERVKELEKTEEEIRKEREKELQEIKEKVIKLTKQLDQTIKADKVVFDLLGNLSNENDLYSRAKSVVDTIRLIRDTVDLIETETAEDKVMKRENILDTLEVHGILGDLIMNVSVLAGEYRKEKFWWDKWTKTDFETYKHHVLKGSKKKFITWEQIERGKNQARENYKYYRDN